MLLTALRTRIPKLTKLTRHLENEIDKAVRRTAFKLQKRAVERLTIAVYSHDKKPTPTGALRASIFTRTHKTDNYRQQMLKATGLRAKRDGAVKLDQIATPPDTPRKGEAWVGVGMMYGVHIEYPTRGRPGSYFMAGAARDVRAYFLQEVKQAIIDAGQGGTIDSGFERLLSEAQLDERP
jgi:hypothetical protein